MKGLWPYSQGIRCSCGLFDVERMNMIAAEYYQKSEPPLPVVLWTNPPCTKDLHVLALPERIISPTKSGLSDCDTNPPNKRKRVQQANLASNSSGPITHFSVF